MGSNGPSQLQGELSDAIAVDTHMCQIAPSDWENINCSRRVTLSTCRQCGLRRNAPANQYNYRVLLSVGVIGFMRCRRLPV